MPAQQKEDVLRQLGAVRCRIDDVIGMVETDTASPAVMQEVARLQASLERVGRALLLVYARQCLLDALGQDAEGRLTALLEEFPLSVVSTGL